ncbi:MAG: T9SS type A sorting domain-containing protein [Ignavibacteria bacterium]|nr:T9SS type A sorting domain-containing protein [Ignavibacteria bacterium]
MNSRKKNISSAKVTEYINKILTLCLRITLLFYFSFSAAAVFSQSNFNIPVVFVSRNHLSGGNILFPSAGLLPGMGPHSRFTVTGGRLMVREVDGTVRTLIDSTISFNGIHLIDVQQPCVDWGGVKIVFSGIESRDSSWRIYEINKDGSGFKKITKTDRDVNLTQFGAAAYRFLKYDDIDPVYTPDGKIVFASTRFPTVSEFGSVLATNLFIIDTSGNNLFRITSERNGAEKPTIDPTTGRIVYSRWWLNIDMPSNQTASGLTRNVSEALTSDIGNIWQVNIINPDGDALKFYSGDARKRNTLFTYRPRIAANNDLFGVFVPHMPMVFTGGSSGIRFYMKGLSEYKYISGVDTSTSLYISNPPSTGTYMPPYSTDPLPLPDGRVMFSYANSVEVQDYGIYAGSRDGTGIQQIVDLPGTLELNAELLIQKTKPPVPSYVTDYDTNKVPPISNPSSFYQGGFFRFDNMNIYANAPVDVPIDDAPPLTKNAKFRFFLNFQRQNPDGQDMPIFFREITINYDGKIAQPDLPANVSMFEQVTDSAGHVLMNDDGKIAHVTGMNFGKNGSGTKCVGCHSGHSLMPVPINNAEAQYTNYSTSASVTQSSYRQAGNISYTGKKVIDRKARNTDLGVNWIAAGGNNEYVELVWVLPLDVREIKLYNIFPNLINGTNIQVTDCEIFLYNGAAQTGHIASTGALDANGKSVIVSPVVSMDRMKIIVKSFTGTINGISSAGLAEVETIARVTTYQTGIGNPNIIASEFALYQNYPNPFNPVTKIRFDIPGSGKLNTGNGNVILKVFDISGKETAELVNESLKPGSYEVTFDGSKLSSGVYFYQLAINNKQLAVKKMLMIK